MLRVLFLGDVVGRPGRRAVASFLRGLKERPDFVIANGENASGGKGIDPETAEELQDAGVDVITTGNHVWQKREIAPYLAETERVLRPVNMAPGVPGVGATDARASHPEAHLLAGDDGGQRGTCDAVARGTIRRAAP